MLYTQDLNTFDEHDMEFLFRVHSPCGPQGVGKVFTWHSRQSWEEMTYPKEAYSLPFSIHLLIGMYDTGIRMTMGISHYVAVDILIGLTV